MKFLYVLALIIGTSEAMASNLVARGGIHSPDGRNFKITEPADTTYDSGGFLLASNSDIDGVCRGFGYNFSLPSSTQFADRVEGRRSFIDANGNAIGIIVNPSYIVSLICTNESYNELPTVLSARGGSYQMGAGVVRYVMPVDGSIDPTTTIQLSASSDADGVCFALSRSRAVTGSMGYEEGPSLGRRSVIGRRGVRTFVDTDTYFVSSIDCFQI